MYWFNTCVAKQTSLQLTQLAGVGTWRLRGVGVVRQQGREDGHHSHKKSASEKSEFSNTSLPYSLKRSGENLYLWPTSKCEEKNGTESNNLCSCLVAVLESETRKFKAGKKILFHYTFILTRMFNSCLKFQYDIVL